MDVNSYEKDEIDYLAYNLEAFKNIFKLKIHAPTWVYGTRMSLPNYSDYKEEIYINEDWWK